jgi:hypothetical protein
MTKPIARSRLETCSVPIGLRAITNPPKSPAAIPASASVRAIASQNRPRFENPWRDEGVFVDIGRLSRDRRSTYTASRNRSEGFSIVTTVFGGTLFVNDTLAPITEFAPTIVVPPRTVAFA